MPAWQRFQSHRKGAVGLVSEFSDWFGGHCALGQVRLIQGRFEESVTELEAANAMKPSSGNNVLLTMAYYKLQRYRESAQSMQRALRMDRTALSPSQSVIAAAYSLLALGHVEAADDLLTKHQSLQPEAVNDDYFTAAVSRVKKELAKTSPR